MTKRVKSIYNPRNYSPNVIIHLHNNRYERQRKKDLFCAFGAIIFVIVVFIITFLIITK